MLRLAFRISGTNHIFLGYLGDFVIVALVIWRVEPAIERFGDGLWYCFAVATTLGFGDITAATVPGRILSGVLSVYSICVVAIFTAIITGYFMDLAKGRAGDSAKEFLYDLEHLPELSKEELQELSDRVKKFVRKK